MYIPDDIWIYLKSFIFPIKTNEMIYYDEIMIELINMKQRAETLLISDIIDQKLYDTLSISEKINFVNKFIYKKYILHS